MVLVCMGGGGDHRGDGWAGGGPSNCFGLTRRVAVIYGTCLLLRMLTLPRLRILKSDQNSATVTIVPSST